MLILRFFFEDGQIASGHLLLWRRGAKKLRLEGGDGETLIRLVRLSYWKPGKMKMMVS